MGARGVSSIIAVIVIVIAIAALVTIGIHFRTQKAKFATYTSIEYSFKFDYPSDWSTGGIDTRQIIVPWLDRFTASYFRSSGGTSLAGTTQAYITLTVYDKTLAENGFGISLDNLTSYISGIENGYENTLIGQPAEIAVDNHMGVTWSYLERNELRHQIEQVVRDNYLYWLEILTLKENYSYFEPIFQHVIDSFFFLS